jgi:ribulose 1,5-bisphosphate synthetase/thiazole synthase
MVKPLSGRLITEPARQTMVCREADVVVVGGGPGGASGAGIFHFSCKQNGKTSC